MKLPKNQKTVTRVVRRIVRYISPLHGGIFQWAHQVPILLHAQFFGPFNFRVLKQLTPYSLEMFFLGDHLVS